MFQSLYQQYSCAISSLSLRLHEHVFVAVSHRKNFQSRNVFFLCDKYTQVRERDDSVCSYEAIFRYGPQEYVGKTCYSTNNVYGILLLLLLLLLLFTANELSHGGSSPYVSNK